MNDLHDWLYFGVGGAWIILISAASFVSSAIAVVFLFVVKTRKAIILISLVGLTPLMFGLIRTALRFNELDRIIALTPDIHAETIEMFRSEAWATTYFGALASVIPITATLVAYFIKKKIKL